MNFDLQVIGFVRGHVGVELFQSAPTVDPSLEILKAAAQVIAAIIVGVIGGGLTAYFTLRRGALDARIQLCFRDSTLQNPSTGGILRANAFVD